MKKILILLLVLSLNSSALAANYIEENLKNYKWNNVDVAWLEDSSFPTYNITFYFHEGALSEDKRKIGVTEMMFSELTSGSSRYSRAEILDVLEFYGASYGANITHEYTTFSLSGLVKDLEPSLKMVCHLFKNATFPEKEFAKTKKRAETGLKNLVNNHGALASRIFRELSLKNTMYSKPVSGNRKSLKRIKARDLHSRLKTFNNQSKKKIYIKAPKGIKGIDKIIANDCGWDGKVQTKVMGLKETKKSTTNKEAIYFVPVKGNQAQIRIGNYLSTVQSKKDYTLNELASRYMGGGFTSVLVQELRVKRGLTYSAGAYASSQSTYGRAGISTFTKNKTIVETLNVIKEVIERESKKIPEQNFIYLKRFLKGSYLFGLESSTAFLRNLLFFDHLKRPYSDIYNFPNEVDSITKVQAQTKISEIFGWENQYKMVLGDRSLIKVLRKAGFKVKVLNYLDYL
jgi:zinc protease